MGQCSSTRQTTFRVNVVVKDAVGSYGGSIQCLPEEPGKYTYKWYNRDVEMTEISSIQAEASNLVAGRYKIYILNALGYESVLTVVVNQQDLPTIIDYIVHDATGDFARNGKIEVVYKNLPSCNFLWTSGVVTHDAILHDVTPGMYSALPISTMNEAIHFHHVCKPAIVQSSRRKDDDYMQF